jgi:Nitrile hydratase, alpha chain
MLLGMGGRWELAAGDERGKGRALAQGPQPQAKAYGQMVARAWQDEAFKQRLMADPHAVLAELGIDVPPGRTVQVLEDTEQVTHLVIPLRPGELSDEQLEQVAGGDTTCPGPCQGGCQDSWQS